MNKMKIEYFSPESKVFTLNYERTVICDSPVTSTATVEDYTSNEYEW